MAMNYTEIEVKVREATNADEPWGPHGTIMAEISKATYGYEVRTERFSSLSAVCCAEVFSRPLADCRLSSYRPSSPFSRCVSSLA